MLTNKIKLKKNELTMFHTHLLTDEEIDFVITNIDAVKFINRLIKEYNQFYGNEEKLNNFPFTKKQFNILLSLKDKLIKNKFNINLY